MDDARQRAREAFDDKLPWSALTGAHNPVDSRRMLREAVEAYFDERIRGEDALATMRDNRDMARVEADVFRARVAELEAVVRAADAVHARLVCEDRADLAVSDAYQAARAKVEVPGE